MKFNCPKCGKEIEMSEHSLYLAGNKVVCSACASMLTVDNGYAYILNDKVTLEDLTKPREEKKPRSLAADIRDPEVASIFDDAVKYISTCNAISIIMLQRYFDIPAERAAKLMQVLEEKGIVGPYNGGAPRRILIPHHTDLPFAVGRRKGDIVDQALEQMENARNEDYDKTGKYGSYSCGCSTFSLLLFGLLLLYFVIQMLNH